MGGGPKAKPSCNKGGKNGTKRGTKRELAKARDELKQRLERVRKQRLHTIVGLGAVIVLYVIYSGSAEEGYNQTKCSCSCSCPACSANTVDVEQAHSNGSQADRSPHTHPTGSSGSSEEPLPGRVLLGRSSPQLKGKLTLTADNTFVAYLDGIELVPANAQRLQDACKGTRTTVSNSNKYCACEKPTGPRCQWDTPETFSIDVKNPSSILAVQIINFGGAATDPLTGGANPAGLLAEYTHNGKSCLVSDTTWKCTYALGATSRYTDPLHWTREDYDDGWWFAAHTLGRNQWNAWVGTPGHNQRNGQSIWYSMRGEIPGISPEAHWIWSGADAPAVTTWCRARISNC